MYAFWFVSFSMSGVVFTTLTTGFLDWDRISDHFMPTNEVSRAFLASFILVMDLMIVMQVSVVCQVEYHKDMFTQEEDYSIACPNPSTPLPHSQALVFLSLSVVYLIGTGQSSESNKC